ncbi:hypothetical protein [Streptomyces radiopugnans]|uniref:hypothetical protein n=1 Tax=Streptomyces radiopugnans TaxID=403935 RepID=UPI003F1D5299
MSNTPFRAPAGRDTVRGDLLRLRDLYEESIAAQASAARPPAERVAGRRRTHRHRGIALDDRAVSVRSDVLAVLTSWTGMVADERAVPAPPDARVPSLVGFLEANLDWLLGHPAGADFAGETAELNAALCAVLDREPAPRDREVGTCAVPGCGRVVRATSAGRRPEVRCEAGHMWQARHWLLLGRPPAAASASSAP